MQPSLPDNYEDVPTSYPKQETSVKVIWIIVCHNEPCFEMLLRVEGRMQELDALGVKSSDVYTTAPYQTQVLHICFQVSF